MTSSYPSRSRLLSTPSQSRSTSSTRISPSSSSTSRRTSSCTPAAGHASGTLVNALIAHCGDSLSGIGGVKRPGIVHRLDKGTSGLLVVAKTDAAARRASPQQFAAHGADRRLERAYLALVWGKPPRLRGTIEARLARSQSNRTKIAIVKGAAGRHAVTHYEVLKTFAPRGAATISLLRLRLESTGRTHQIRVHLAHIGHPVVRRPRLRQRLQGQG